MLWCFGQTVGAHSMPPVHCARELSRTNQEPHPRELWLLGWCVFCAPGTGKLLGSSLCPRCFFFLGENALLFAFGLSPLSRASLQIVRGGHFICGYNVASIPTVRDVPRQRTRFDLVDILTDLQPLPKRSAHRFGNVWDRRHAQISACARRFWYGLNCCGRPHERSHIELLHVLTQ